MHGSGFVCARDGDRLILSVLSQSLIPGLVEEVFFREPLVTNVFRSPFSVYLRVTRWRLHGVCSSLLLLCFFWRRTTFHTIGPLDPLYLLEAVQVWIYISGRSVNVPGKYKFTTDYRIYI